MVSYVGEWVAGLILWRVLQMRPLPGRIFLRQTPNSRPQRPSVASVYELLRKEFCARQAHISIAR